MKIALAQLNYIIGDFGNNCRKIIDCIRQGKNAGVDLVVFAELSVCGYPPRDFLNFDDFIDQSNKAIDQIAAECKGVAAIVGAPTRNPDPKGKNLFNSALLLCDGKVKATVNKTLLPNYDIFDEYRYFEPNRHFELVELKGIKLGITICEDIWNLGPDPLYVSDPMAELSVLNPDIIINIAASPFSYSQDEERLKILRENCVNYQKSLIYVNHSGAQTELLFDGNSRVVGNNGKVLLQCNAFSEDFRIFDFDKGLPVRENERENPVKIQRTAKAELIHKALVMGIADYFNKMGFNKAILGLSGGIDSAVTLVLAAEAIGPKNVLAVLLPSKFSSRHSVDDAIRLADNLQVPYKIISIEKPFETLAGLLEQQWQGLPFDVTEENIQARLRAVILMALANKQGYILLNTSNKSEAAVGYGTLYGDMCGGISVLGDVYKTEVYELASFINRNKEIIPHHSIVKPPSAELRPGQKDSDSLPDYSLLDSILYQYIEKHQSPADIVALGFDAGMVSRILKMVNTNEWKRQQTPPVLRVSPKAFGPGRRMPIVGKYLS